MFAYWLFFQPKYTSEVKENEAVWLFLFLSGR